MDPYGIYKDKIGTRIANIIGESLLQLKITQEDADQMGNYVLENIDLAKTNSELFDFLTSLSAKWPIFNSILTSVDDQVPAPAPVQAQEKTDEMIHKAEDLIKENKIDEALDVAKTANKDIGQNVGGAT